MASGRGLSGRPPSGESGFTLLGVLFLVALIGLGLAALGAVWGTAAKREKEAQLLFVGDQYRRALDSYYRATPGADKRFPRDLRHLLLDPRFPNTVRHLRRLYADPMTGREEWGLVKRGEEITGLYSLSEQPPLKTGDFPKPYEAFAGSRSHRDWVFSALPAAAPAGETPPARNNQEGAGKR
jgi:type II secretory pathway pseudopilin PulG